MNIRFFSCQVLVCVFLFIGVGCVSMDYNKLSQGSGVPENVLAKNCPNINCSYDNLEDRLQVGAQDFSFTSAFVGSQSWSIKYDWVSSWDKILVKVATTSLYSGWKHVKTADIYIGKEKVASLDGGKDSFVGKYNDVAKKHELVEIVEGFVDIAIAERIARTSRENVTIRFYSKNGYTDEKIRNDHSRLIQVTNIAKSK